MLASRLHDVLRPWGLALSIALGAPLAGASGVMGVPAAWGAPSAAATGRAPGVAVAPRAPGLAGASGRATGAGATAAAPAPARPPTPAGPQAGPTTPRVEGRTAESDLAEAVARLSDDERSEAAGWFALEARGLGNFQRGLLEHVRAAQDRDPGFWPAAGEAPVYDPAVHAPRQPIPRRRLDRGDRAAVELRARVERAAGGAPLPAAWRYDWASGGVVRVGDPDDPARVLAAGLAGQPPDLELARALVLRALDRGEERAALAAFAHAYTDRAGNVYPGVTLYDAWRSGMEMEMPDVDVLGVVHDVLDEWRQWVAPVPASKHDALYARVGEVFQRARRYRGLREALAETYLASEPALGDGYAANLDRFHALWDVHASDPAALAAALPHAEEWEDFLAAWVRRCAKEPELLAHGRARREALAASEAEVRARLAFVVAELAAARPPAAAPEGASGG